MQDQVKVKPEVGAGVTWNGYSDRYVGTIVKVTAKTITVQEDSAKLLNGPTSGEPDALHFERGGFFGHTSGIQRYAYAPNPSGEIYTFTLRNNGLWVKSKCSAYSGPRLQIGVRDKHHDYNF